MSANIFLHRHVLLPTTGSAFNGGELNLHEACNFLLVERRSG
ncbi:MAG: hypothetical protein OEL79_11270 [Chromatiales bacterium]|nr:hypothetical protein [Chromatiales bacterium]